MHVFEVAAVKERLREVGGGYKIVHESAGLEVGVYGLVAPEPDRQQPHGDDELYVVLEGTGVLEVEGEEVRAREGTLFSWGLAPSIASPRTSTSASSSYSSTSLRKTRNRLRGRPRCERSSAAAVFAETRDEGGLDEPLDDRRPPTGRRA